jgi:hypothetical protein
MPVYRIAALLARRGGYEKARRRGRSKYIEHRVAIN